MEYNSLNHFAYSFIGLMKKSLHKKSEDLFLLRDFDICKIKLRRDDALSSLSMIQLKEILSFIDVVSNVFREENDRIPTYSDLREKFKNKLYKANETNTTYHKDTSPKHTIERYTVWNLKDNCKDERMFLLDSQGFLWLLEYEQMINMLEAKKIDPYLKKISNQIDYEVRIWK